MPCDVNNQSQVVCSRDGELYVDAQKTREYREEFGRQPDRERFPVMPAGGAETGAGGMASTGLNTLPWLVGSGSLLLAGAGAAIRRRKR
ncbi:MAG: LPXTG cell wall anchor domain-containing protein [Actinomycetota bacterium]|nr:LPXTG cell wall anchor domain-containing protein [Actinomycetota bacterium]